MLDIEKLDTYISERIYNDIRLHNITGCSVAVADCSKILYKRHFGTLSVSDSRPINGNTLFRLASMTKPVTSVAVMTLVERGLIGIDDPIEKFLPQFCNMHTVKMSDSGPKTLGKVQTKPTIKHLLTHTSGILAGECGAYYKEKMPNTANEYLKSAVDYYSSIGLSFEPFSANEYSAVAAFDILALIIENVSDIGFDEYIGKYITEPCGMHNTVFVPSEAQWGALIPMYNKIDGTGAVYPMKPGCVFDETPCTHFLGGAGLISSLDDYIRFAQMLLRGGEINGNRILSENTVKFMSEPQVPESIMHGNERWGLGMRVITSDEYKYLPKGTFGWSGAYGTHFWVDPVNGITAVYMKNSVYDGGSGAITAANFEKDVFNSLKP